MGGGSWSEAAYTARVHETKKSGKSLFAYSDSVSSGAAPRAAHDKLDPKKLKNGIREARDSAAHPDSKPVFIGLDVTGSMSSVPKQIQEKLPTLMGLLTRRGYLADPAICVSAIGDAAYDSVPFQVGQFESGIEIDDDIRNLFLEGGGGGNMHESYELALFFLARCTAFDAWEKRKQKGYAFIVGDEELNERLDRSHVEKAFGSSMGLEGDLSVDALVGEVLERWELYYIIPNMTSHYNDPQYSVRWRKLLGERVLRLDNPEGIAELIASTIGILEDNADIDSIVSDLTSEGASSATANSVSRSLATVSGGRALSGLTGGKTGLVSL